jgi:hypothetical protein
MGIFNWDDWGVLSGAALLLWIPFSLWLFTVQRPVRAATHSMVWAMMWLPEAAAFDLPLLPPFSKYTIGCVCALIGLLWKAPKRLKAARVGRGYDLIIYAYVLAQIGTVLTNPDPLHYGTYKTIDLPGFTPYDGVSSAVRVLLYVMLPVVVGRALLRSRRDLVDVLTILTVAGLVYSLPIFYELRMSPMLHENIYGFTPRDDWSQNLRGGGYRATVFMGHGLVVGFFLFLSTLSAVALHRAGKRNMYGVPMGLVVLYLFGVLVMCKAVATVIYGAIGYVLLRFVSVKNAMRVLIFLTVIVISYPVSRMFEVFPVQEILSAAETLGPERVQSMQFRFDNEDLLLAKGSERLWFGWGGFNRERVYDAESAKDLVIQDGQWIVIFGTQGFIGFCCYFAFMVLPVFRAPKQLKKVKRKDDRILLVAFGYLVVICAVNMLPNMHLPNLQFVFAMGLSALLREVPREEAMERAKSVRPGEKKEQDTTPPPAPEEPALT